MSLRPFALERYFARHEFSARYLLGSSDPESMSVRELLALEPGSEAGLGDLRLGYTESLGHPDLRRDIAATYTQTDPDSIMVFSGAEEPIYTFMNAALEAGDHIVVHFPSYQSHHAVAQARGIDVSLWKGDPAAGWAPEPSELEDLIRPETVAILVCTPHNPTGWLADARAWARIVDIARAHDLWLFSDEVYRGLEHEPSTRLPQACDLYEKGISLNCLSKSCGLAGLRIGWIATRDRELFAKLAAYKDYLSICNSAPSEYLAGIAVRHMETLFGRSRERVVRNLDLLEAFFARRSDIFRWMRPGAGSTTFPEYTAGDSFELCERLVAETGIMLVPGRFFDIEGGFIRFGYGRENLPEVLPLLEEWLERAAPRPVALRKGRILRI